MDDAAILPVLDRLEPLGPDAVRCHAPAKLNLDLYVGPPRADGFHDLDSAVVLVSLYDRIELRLRAAGGVELACVGADCGPPQRNLAVRAAAALLEAIGERRGVSIALEKHIPPGGGMGGGSSDAAAVLTGLNHLLGNPLPASRLTELAAGLGSDVPLFLGPSSSRMTGRGERVAPLAVGPLTALVLPGAHACPTPDVYRELDAMRASGDSPGPDPAASRADMSGPCELWRDSLVNHLAAPACRVCPPMAADLRAMSSALAPVRVHVTGSGSSLFALASSADELARLRRRLPGGLEGRCICCAKI